jgi:hypothetical protein
MLEAGCWLVCGEAWVRGQREMSQVLGVFGLPDFTMLRPVLAWCTFWNLWTVYFFNFFSGHGKPRIRGSACTMEDTASLHPWCWRSNSSVVLCHVNQLTHCNFPEDLFLHLNVLSYIMQ